MKDKLMAMDKAIFEFFSKYAVSFSRFSLFLIYFWFGILKIVGQSPASELVHHLFDKTLASFISFDIFFVLFSLFEVGIGISFLFPKLIRLSLYATLVHMFTTFMPLILLANEAWTAAFVPTFEGQYILKNFIIISLVLMLVKNQMERKVTR